ncbi:MAG: MerR family transcriptional regulator [Candidatus Krumholzibacteriia bacterium]
MTARMGDEDGNGNDLAGAARTGTERGRGHPIGVVARRTAIPPDLLRAWEKRYGAVRPHRTETGRRLYSDLDVQRLRLMKRLVEGRRRISDVARLGLDELKALVREDEREAVVPARTRPRPPVGTLQQLLKDAVDAAVALDRQRLEQVLQDAAVAFAPGQVRRELLVPLMESIGDRWQEGSLRVVHEHMASAIVRTILASIAQRQAADAAPVVVATTPAGQRHEIGALLAAAAASEMGWDVLYLGPDLPAEEIAAAAVQRAARAVMLSIVHPANDPRLPDQLRQVRRYLGTGYPLLVGGRAVGSYREVLDEIDAVVVEDLGDLNVWLTRLST